MILKFRIVLIGILSMFVFPVVAHDLQDIPCSIDTMGKSILFYHSESALKSAIQRNITLMSGVSIGKLVETSNSTQPMSHFSHETSDRNYLPDSCRASWKCGGELE